MRKLVTVPGSALLAAAAMVCSLHFAFAGGPGSDVAPLSPSPAPSNGWAVPLSPSGQSSSIPQNGWSTPEPSAGSGAMPPASNAAAPAAPGVPGQTATVPATSQGEGQPGIVAGGTSAVGPRTAVNKASSVAAQPKLLVPGIDTHPTVEKTSSGIEIIRGPASE